MNPNKGPLLIIAAALFRNGTTSFYGGRGRFCEYSANVSYAVAVLPLMWGVRGNHPQTLTP
jgi:hypothetical protein